jgi:uncharacterized protein YutE (UPF0331/DUF86 family)
MNDEAGLQTLRDYLKAIDAICAGLGEVSDALPDRPMDSAYFKRFSVAERIASRALLKAFEQLQDLISKLIRLTLILENEDLTGLSARAIADRAETLNLISNADRWSALTKLRNRLVHEYPLTEEQQFHRFHEVWNEQFGLLAMIGVIYDFLREREYIGDDDD